MKCPECQRPNPEHAVFCFGCGSRLARVCPSCGRPHKPESSFCNDCGQRLEDAPVISEHRRLETGDIPAGAEAERRLLTLMFCDLAGSTELSMRLDPEEWRDVVAVYQRVCAEGIKNYEGHLARYFGDGILAYFGYPKAHEDDPVRAVNAAMQILARVPELNAHLHESVGAMRGHSLAIRIGIHTGLVVVGEMGAGAAREAQALGPAPNLAARLQGIAAPDSVVMSDATCRLVGCAFEVRDLGTQHLKGFDAPLRVHQAVRSRNVRGGLELSAGTGIVPLVGRDTELALLIDRWKQARTGRGHVVLVSGEAGIGKSRLVQSLRKDVTAADALWLEFRCSPYHQNTAFHPLLVAVEEELGLTQASNGIPSQTVARLHGALEAADLDPPTVLPLVAHLLGLPVPEGYALHAESSEARRRRTLDGLLAWVKSTSRQLPLVLVVEDLHWADPSTIDALGRLVEAASDMAVLQVLTFRDGFKAPWQAGDGLTRIVLQALPADAVRLMVDAIASGQDRVRNLPDLVVSKADGIPLFVEELTKSLLESQWTEADDVPEIPTTLQGSLMARLDRLGPAKDLAQCASVLGREVSADVLAEVSPMDPHDLREVLDRLVHAGLLLESGRTARSTYTFRHALIQEAAYQSLLRKRRRVIHARVVEAFERIARDGGAVAPEILAHHCERAQRIEPAILYLLQAGAKAMHRSAHREAVAHLEHGLDLVTRLPANQARNELELSLRIAIGAPIVSTRGYGHPDVASSHNRARYLSREIGEGPQLYQAVGMLYLFHAAHADMRGACELSTQLVDLGVRHGDPFVELFGEVFSGITRFYEGRFPSALVHFDRVRELEERCAGRPAWYVHEHDPRVIVRSYGAMTLAVTGREAAASSTLAEALDLARHCEEPFNLGFALAYATLTHQLLDDAERVLHFATEGISLCETQGFPEYLAIATMLRGWANARLGAAEKGIEDLRRGMALGSATGTIIEAPRGFALLAEAERCNGGWDEALAAVETGLALSGANGNRYWDAELRRIAAELRFQRRPESREGFAALSEASKLAHEQGAFLLERRITDSLQAHNTTRSNDSP